MHATNRVKNGGRAPQAPSRMRIVIRDRMTEGSVVFAYKYRTADFDMELVLVRVTAIATQSQMSLLSFDTN